MAGKTVRMADLRDPSRWNCSNCQRFFAGWSMICQWKMGGMGRVWTYVPRWWFRRLVYFNMFILTWGKWTNLYNKYVSNLLKPPDIGSVVFFPGMMMYLHVKIGTTWKNIMTKSIGCSGLFFVAWFLMYFHSEKKPWEELPFGGTIFVSLDKWVEWPYCQSWICAIYRLVKKRCPTAQRYNYKLYLYFLTSRSTWFVEHFEGHC